MFLLVKFLQVSIVFLNFCLILSYAAASHGFTHSPVIHGRSHCGTGSADMESQNISSVILEGGGIAVLRYYSKRCSHDFVGLKEYSKQPQYYYVCNKDSVIFAKCGNLEVFNGTSLCCESYSFLPYFKPLCTHEGNHPIAHDTSKYYRCNRNMEPRIFSCPSQHTFSPLLHSCIAAPITEKSVNLPTNTLATVTTESMATDSTTETPVTTTETPIIILTSTTEKFSTPAFKSTTNILTTSTEKYSTELPISTIPTVKSTTNLPTTLALATTTTNHPTTLDFRTTTTNHLTTLDFRTTTANHPTTLDFKTTTTTMKVPSTEDIISTTERITNCKKVGEGRGTFVRSGIYVIPIPLFDSTYSYFRSTNSAESDEKSSREKVPLADKCKDTKLDCKTRTVNLLKLGKQLDLTFIRLKLK